MKTQNILVGLSLLLLSSCSDFLDKTPLVQTSVQTYYSTDDEANTSIIGIYSIMQNESFQLAPFMIIGDDRTIRIWEIAIVKLFHGLALLLNLYRSLITCRLIG